MALDSIPARIVDVQSVLHGHLTLTAVVEVPQGSDCLRRALFKVSELGLRLEVAMHHLPSPESMESPAK